MKQTHAKVVAAVVVVAVGVVLVVGGVSAVKDVIVSSSGAEARSATQALTTRAEAWMVDAPRYVCPRCHRKLRVSDVVTFYHTERTRRFCGACLLNVLEAIVPIVEEIAQETLATPKPEGPQR